MIIRFCIYITEKGIYTYTFLEDGQEKHFLMSWEPCFLENREMTSLQAELLEEDRQKFFLITEDCPLKIQAN